MIKNLNITKSRSTRLEHVEDFSLAVAKNWNIEFSLTEKLNQGIWQKNYYASAGNLE